MKTKNAFLIGIIALMILSWYTLYTSITDNVSNYKKYIASAQTYDEEGFYIEAIECYENAYAINPDNYELRRAIAIDDYHLQKYSSFVSEVKTVIEAEGGDLELSLMLIQYYIDTNSLVKAFSAINEGLDYFPDNDQITELYDSIKGKVAERGAYCTTVTDFRDGYAIASYGDYYYLITDEGKDAQSNQTYSMVYDFAAKSSGSDFLISGVSEEHTGYFDQDDYFRLTPETKYDYLGSIHNGYALVSRDGVWGYIDEDSFEEHMMEFEAATPFADGYAAVCKDGKWAVISSSLSYVTDFIYDEVAVDDYGTCSVGKRVFAKRDGAYYLVNTKGEELSGEYEDAKPFLSSGGYAAVCMNGKWGLVDSDGTIVLECRFEELDSSNEGFAGYKKGDLWGYITVKGEIMIEANYAEVKAFTDDGYAYVSNGSNWYLIQLYLYE